MFVNPVIPPASAREMGLIRLSLMADHTPALLEEAAEALLKVFTDQDQLPAGRTRLSVPGVRPLRRVAVGPGTGEPSVIVLLHGYGMQPETYIPMAHHLDGPGRRRDPRSVRRARVVDLRPRASTASSCTLDDVGMASYVSLIAHSFGGALLLGFAARRPDRIVECVFGDTLGVNREMILAVEAVHPLGIMRMATRPAASTFVRSSVTRPVPLASAALWAFVDDREAEIEAVAARRPAVSRVVGRADTVLSRADGRSSRTGSTRTSPSPSSRRATGRSTTTGCSTTPRSSPRTSTASGCTRSRRRAPERQAAETLEALLPVVVAGLGVEDER